MTATVPNAKVWDGSQWVEAIGYKTEQDFVFPLSVAIDGVVNSTMAAVNVTANSSAHTFGSWTQLVASTTAATSMIQFRSPASTNGVASGTIIQFGVGAAGSETAIFSAAIGSFASGQQMLTIFVPVGIPAGSRISARVQSVITGGRTVAVSVFSFWQVGNFASATEVDTYGVNTATSRGTNIAASSAWTEITSSTTRDYRALVIIPSASNSNMLQENVIMDLGIGASGSEVVKFQHEFSTNTNETIVVAITRINGGFYVGHVPVGSRIAVRQNTARTYFDATVLGIPYL
jgi:hypothetical protein